MRNAASIGGCAAFVGPPSDEEGGLGSLPLAATCLQVLSPIIRLVLGGHYTYEGQPHPRPPTSDLATRAAGQAQLHGGKITAGKRVLSQTYHANHYHPFTLIPVMLAGALLAACTAARSSPADGDGLPTGHCPGAAADHLPPQRALRTPTQPRCSRPAPLIARAKPRPRPGERPLDSGGCSSSNSYASPERPAHDGAHGSWLEAQ